MACPTCDHTMQKVGDNQDESMFWCPRCGTLKSTVAPSTHVPDDISVPTLVNRCREFETDVVGEFPILVAPDWRTIGIAESINLPGARQS